MTVTVELSPEEEASLRPRAESAGVSESEFVRSLINGGVGRRKGTGVRKASGSSRGYGKYAYVKTSSEEFARRKEAEIALEDRPR